MLSTSTNVRRDQDEILEGHQRRHSIFFNSTNVLFRRLASIEVGGPPGISTTRTATESAEAATGAPARGASTGTESRVSGDEENVAPGDATSGNVVAPRPSRLTRLASFDAGLIPPIQSIGNQQDADSDSAAECGSEDDESSTHDIDELHTDSGDATPESRSPQVVADSATQQSVLGDTEDKVPSLYRASTPIITLLRSLPIPVIDATETVNPAEGTYVSASVQVDSSLAEEESSADASEHCVSDSESDGHSEHSAEPVRIHGNGNQGVPGKEVDLEDITPERLMAAHILVALHQGSARAYTSPKTKAYQEWKKERAETSDGVPADDEVHGDDKVEPVVEPSISSRGKTTSTKVRGKAKELGAKNDKEEEAENAGPMTRAKTRAQAAKAKAEADADAEDDKKKEKPKAKARGKGKEKETVEEKPKKKKASRAKAGTKTVGKAPASRSTQEQQTVAADATSATENDSPSDEVREAAASQSAQTPAQATAARGTKRAREEDEEGDKKDEDARPVRRLRASKRGKKNN